MIKDSYESPLNSRYASKEMKYIFSPDKKFKTWRRLWVALAEAEMELGLAVTPEQVAELKEHMDDINYEVAEEREKEVRHDVMSHVYAYGVQCPKAKGIIHLGVACPIFILATMGRAGLSITSTMIFLYSSKYNSSIGFPHSTPETTSNTPVFFNAISISL